MKQALIDILDLFEKVEIKPFFPTLSTAIIHLYHMEKMNLAFDTRVRLSQIMEKHLPDIIYAYLAIPASERNQVLRQNQTATEILVDKLILIKHEIESLWANVIEENTTHFLVMNRKLDMIHANGIELEVEHNMDKSVGVNETANKTPIETANERLNKGHIEAQYDLDTEVNHMLQEYRLERNWNNGFKTQKEQEKIQQKKGLNPAIFSLIAMSILGVLIFFLF